jgi:hypothetical protein
LCLATAGVGMYAMKWTFRRFPMMRTEMVLEMLVYLPFSHFSHLLALEYFINISVFLPQEYMFISLSLVQLV